jgi:hypothetical protein
MIQLIYIAGYGYSGSTLLDILLGSHPDIESVGELCNLHSRGWIMNKKCACGNPGRECPFWSQVMSRWQLLSGFRDVEGYIRLQRQIESWKNPSAWFRNRKIESNDSILKHYAEETGALFQAIAKTSSKSCIVDSSKLPLRALALISVSSIDLRIIHLVRDLRGVLWSMLKRRKPHKTVWPIVMRGILGWNIANRQAEGIRNLVPDGKYRRVRYEDLATHTQLVLQKIEPLAELPLAEIGKRFAGGDTIQIGHIIAGNRIRKRGGAGLQLNADFAWKSNLSPVMKKMAEILGGPLMKRYGYLAEG